MPAYLIPSGHPMYYLQRASTNGRHLCAWFCGRVATRFWIKGCLDPESDGIAIRRAFGAVCRNRHDVARSTQSRHPARNHPELAAEMVMERTTLVRALKPLQQADWVITEPSGSGRSLALSISKEGMTKLREANPLWREAQREFEKLYGKGEAAHLREELKKASALAAAKA
jgi:DNA-binding MarR family transcriptional regulator